MIDEIDVIDAIDAIDAIDVSATIEFPQTVRHARQGCPQNYVRRGRL
ncbi:hypothetical protein WME98_36940 [Sorangium sp. So ce296]